MHYLALLIIPVAVCVLALDLIVTLFMLPSATARMAIMFGTFCGVLAAGLGVHMDYLAVETVFYAGIGGGSFGFGAYYLRYFLLHVGQPEEALVPE